MYILGTLRIILGLIMSYKIFKYLFRVLFRVIMEAIYEYSLRREYIRDLERFTKAFIEMELRSRLKKVE